MVFNQLLNLFCSCMPAYMPLTFNNFDSTFHDKRISLFPNIPSLYSHCIITFDREIICHICILHNYVHKETLRQNTCMWIREEHDLNVIAFLVFFYFLGMFFVFVSVKGKKENLPIVLKSCLPWLSFSFFVVHFSVKWLFYTIVTLSIKRFNVQTGFVFPFWKPCDGSLSIWQQFLSA